MADMEAKFPGYKKHIENIMDSMASHKKLSL